MCLGVTGRIKSIKGDIAKVDFEGNVKDVYLDMVTAKVGDYILVHAGFAISKIDQEEAKKNRMIAEEIFIESRK